MTYEEELKHILITEKFLQEWIVLNPKVYYKDGFPYGLIAKQHNGDMMVVISTTSNPAKPFTIGMLKDIVRCYNISSVMLITDDKDYHDTVIPMLNKYGFTFNVDGDILYSTHIKE